MKDILINILGLKFGLLDVFFFMIFGAYIGDIVRFLINA